MLASGSDIGLTIPFATPQRVSREVSVITVEEAGIVPPPGEMPRVKMIVESGETVAQGAPVACLRDAPDVCFVAPMPARIARITLLQGHKLSEVALFREPGDDAVTHDISDADTAVGLRRLMQRSGLWPWLRRRPFGGMPCPEERPAAIFVMATDTRPFAPDPRTALLGQEAAFDRGMNALALLTDGPVFLCQQPGPSLVGDNDASRIHTVTTGRRHPQGAVGLRIHSLFPAGLEMPVWDIHAEDVAALGALIETGQLPMTRLVSIGGSGLRESLLLRTQVGANLRALTHRIAKRGPHVVYSGSPLDAHASQWLAQEHRQVTVLPRSAPNAPQHWLVAALTRSAGPKPVIPTAALDQAFGGILPAAAFVRALSCGDDETAMKLGVLSLLEEDLSLADYVLGGEAHLRVLLRGMLDRIKTEFAA